MEPNTTPSTSPELNATPAPAEPAKKSKGLLFATIIFAILAIAGIGAGAYFFMDTNKKAAENADLRAKVDLLQIETGAEVIEEHTNSGATIKTIETSYLDKEDAEQLISKHIFLGAITRSCPFSGIKYPDEAHRAAIAADRVIGQKSIPSTVDESNSSLNYIVNYDDLNETYKELYGASQDIEKKDFDLSESWGAGAIRQISYNEADNSYTVAQAYGIGSCVGPNDTFTEIASAKKTGNRVDITILVIQTDQQAVRYGQDGITTKSYLYKFIDDGGYALKDIEEIFN